VWGWLRGRGAYQLQGTVSKVEGVQNLGPDDCWGSNHLPEVGGQWDTEHDWGPCVQQRGRRAQMPLETIPGGISLSDLWYGVVLNKGFSPTLFKLLRSTSHGGWHDVGGFQETR